MAISEATATYWTNFAKRGDPNGQGVPAWPAFSDAKSLVMYFSKTPHPGPAPNAEALTALDAYFAWRRTPDGIATGEIGAEPKALADQNRSRGFTITCRGSNT